jgi:hypothetical protein
MTLPYAKLAKNTKPQTAPRAPLSHLEIELNSASTIDKLWLFSIPGTGNKFDNGCYRTHNSDFFLRAAGCYPQHNLRGG